MSGSPRRRVAIVIPWFGRDLRGGAEMQAWSIAAHLSARGHVVDVLTTCCQSFHADWASNHFPPGRESQPEGFTIHRFPVVARRREAFDQVNVRLLAASRGRLVPGRSPISASDEDVFCHELIRSPELVGHVEAGQASYDAFIFLPYFYTPVVQALPKVASKAFLQPCLHDESYAYLSTIDRIFRRARGLLFNSEGELELALRIYGPAIALKSTVVGEGIELPGEHEKADLPADQQERLGRYLLFVGRKTAEKGVDIVIEAFRAHRVRNPASRLNLVLAGSGPTWTSENGVSDLGRVGDADKWALMRKALAVVVPGRNESFSRTMYEAWVCRRPVIVNGGCAATATAVRNAGGGWAAASGDDWEAVFARIEEAAAGELSGMGDRGAAYAAEFASWERAIDRYEAVFDRICPPTVDVVRANRLAQVHQVLPNLSYGDAISNEAIFLRDELRRRGYESHIYARYIDPRVLNECRVFSNGTLPPEAGLIYHHSIGSEVTPAAIRHPGPKALIYHNITPPRFYAPYRPEFAGILDQGLRDLSTIASAFPVSAGDSAFNAAELAGHGFHDPLVLPLAIDPRHWDTPPDPSVMEEMSDGRINVLFVGRIAPNKRQDDLVRAFGHFREFAPGSRLILIGSADTSDQYLEHVQRTARETGLAEAVHIAGHVNDAAMQAYFRTAHLYWSMSEHEGFCVPVIEAMWFDLPVFAYKSTAIPETIGSEGLFFTDKSDLMFVAAAAFAVATDHGLRSTLIAAQHRRRSHYLPERVSVHLDWLLDRMGA